MYICIVNDINNNKIQRIMDFSTTTQIAQMIVNELAGSAFVHKMQGQLFKSQGFAKLGQKYLDHYAEEMAGSRNTPTACWTSAACQR